MNHESRGKHMEQGISYYFFESVLGVYGLAWEYESMRARTHEHMDASAPPSE